MNRSTILQVYKRKTILQLHQYTDRNRLAIAILRRTASILLDVTTNTNILVVTTIVFTPLVIHLTFTNAFFFTGSAIHFVEPYLAGFLGVTLLVTSVMVDTAFVT